MLCCRLTDGQWKHMYMYTGVSQNSTLCWIELNALTYTEVRKHQKASTQKKLWVTIKTVVLIVFDITYFLSLSRMMVKMVKWEIGLIMRTEWQVSEGNTCEERSWDEKMKAPGKQHYIPESMWAEKNKQAWNVKDGRKRVMQTNRCGFDDQMVWFFSLVCVTVLPGI